MSLSIQERLMGAAVGLATADALTSSTARLSPQNVRSLGGPQAGEVVHGATTTWAMQVANALRHRHADESLSKALSTRLIAWTSPMRGVAVRGATGGLASALRQVGGALERGEDPRLSALDEEVADVIPALVPLAFTLGDDDEDVAKALVETVCVTHRALRVTTSAALFIGGLRYSLRTPLSTKEGRLDAAGAFAEVALRIYIEMRAGIVKGNPTEAEGAAIMALASARTADGPSDVWAPPGIDGRDAPERCAVGALLGFRRPSTGIVAMINERTNMGGDCDVTLPLWLSAIGSAVGESGLPLGVTASVLSLPMVRSRMHALLATDAEMRADLVVEEMLWSETAIALEEKASKARAEVGDQAELDFDNAGE